METYSCAGPNQWGSTETGAARVTQLNSSGYAGISNWNGDAITAWRVLPAAIPAARAETVLETLTRQPTSTAWVRGRGRRTAPNGYHAESLALLVPPGLGVEFMSGKQVEKLTRAAAVCGGPGRLRRGQSLPFFARSTTDE